MSEHFDQINSPLVQEQYNKKNYCIEYDCNQKSEKCVIYFSSNSIYFPNTAKDFTKSIIEQDRYEWRKNKVTGVKKHIFIRDIFKQWYLKGINSTINSIENLIAFLQEETKGYDTSCIGNSAGGFIATLVGCNINAQKVLTFNGQFEIATLLYSEEERKFNPLLVKFEDVPTINKYFDVLPHIEKSKTRVYYFNSAESTWDNQQYQVACQAENVYPIRFKSKTHGIPFELQDMALTLSSSERKLQLISNKKEISTFTYSVKLNGLIRAVSYRLGRKFIRNANK